MRSETPSVNGKGGETQPPAVAQVVIAIGVLLGNFRSLTLAEIRQVRLGLELPLPQADLVQDQPPGGYQLNKNSMASVRRSGPRQPASLKLWGGPRRSRDHSKV
jgi:hypothetical protein